MKKLLMALTAIAVFCLPVAGCKITTTEEGEEVVVLQEPTVWTVDSERIVIRENNRDSYTYYDYSRDTLPPKVKTKLYELVTTDTGIVCRSGGETYEITITDGDGLDRVYASADGRCGDKYPWDRFIAVSAIDRIVELLTN